MTGETTLRLLLTGMAPQLHAAEQGFGRLPPGQGVPPGLSPFAVIAEDEGLTVVAPVADLARHGIDHEIGRASCRERVYVLV